MKNLKFLFLFCLFFSQQTAVHAQLLGGLIKSQAPAPFNAFCATANISVTPCSSVSGATANDAVGTTLGTEYNWTGATGNMTGGANRALIEIGGQCWFRRNSVVAPTAPISALPNVSPNTWTNSSQPDNGYWGYFNAGDTSGSAGWSTTEPADGEGLLYQWSAAMNGATTERAQGVCPTDWHVPSDCEWMYLENNLGMSTADQVVQGWRDSGSVGSKLSMFTSSGNNNSGFKALLTGGRLPSTGQFSSRGSQVVWWSSSSDTNNANARAASMPGVGVYRGFGTKASSISVRCLKD
jgi:uncharacterized protein (TIGR02145 family)